MEIHKSIKILFNTMYNILVVHTSEYIISYLV